MIYSSVLFVNVAALAWALRKKNAHWQVGLWSLVLLRVVLPPDLATPWSARSLVEQIPKFGKTMAISLSYPMSTMQWWADSILPTEPPEVQMAPHRTGHTAGWKHLTRQNLAFIIWLAGFTGLLGVYVRSIAKFYRLPGRATEMQDRQWRRILNRWKDRFLVRRQVRLVSSHEFLSPFTQGILRPTIFLPAQLVEAGDPKIAEMCIAHEMAHIRRWDDLWIKIHRISSLI